MLSNFSAYETGEDMFLVKTRVRCKLYFTIDQIFFNCVFSFPLCANAASMLGIIIFSKTVSFVKPVFHDFHCIKVLYCII